MPAHLPAVAGGRAVLGPGGGGALLLRRLHSGAARGQGLRRFERRLLFPVDQLEERGEEWGREGGFVGQGRGGGGGGVVRGAPGEACRGERDEVSLGWGCGGHGFQVGF